jgi:RNA polymerase sigma-70 factor (ECF subfamily)
MQDFHSRDQLPDQQLAQQQHLQLLRDAFQQLPKEKREVLELSRFQDMRYDEIAAVLKCEVGTVKVRVYRAMNELRTKFLELRGREVA